MRVLVLFTLKSKLLMHRRRTHLLSDCRQHLGYELCRGCRVRSAGCVSGDRHSGAEKGFCFL